MTGNSPSDLKVSDVLRRARKLLSDPKKWTKGNYEHAGRFCSIGAVNEVAPKGDENLSLRTKAYAALDKAVKKISEYQSAEIYNDKSTHAAVLKLFDAAIKASKSA